MASLEMRENKKGVSWYCVSRTKNVNDGKQVWERLWTISKNESRKEGREKATELFNAKVAQLANIRLGISVIRPITLKDFAVKYLEYFKDQEYVSVKSYAIKSMFKHGITDMEHFNKYNAKLYIDKCKAQGMNIGGIEHYLAIFVNMGNCMVEWGHVERNPMVGVLKLLKEDKAGERQLSEEDGRWLSDAEIEKYFAVCKQGIGKGSSFQWLTYELFGRIAYYTGFRPGEVMSLQKRDIDFTNGRVHTYCKPEFKFKTKDRKRRYVPLLGGLKLCLLNSAHFQSLKDEELIVPTACNSTITKVRVVNLRHTFVSTLRKKTGIAELLPYCFRHSYAVKMLQILKDEARVAQYLGHSDTRMLRLYYAPFLPDHSSDIIDQINFPLDSQPLIDKTK